MNTETIYEKKYRYKDILAQPEYAVEMLLLAQKEKRDFKEYCEEIQASIELAPIPERDRKCKEFIDIAIEISKSYEIDTVISRHDSHVSVNYAFDCGGNMKRMKPVFSLADNLSFLLRSMTGKLPSVWIITRITCSKMGKLLLHKKESPFKTVLAALGVRVDYRT